MKEANGAGLQQKAATALGGNVQAILIVGPMMIDTFGCGRLCGKQCGCSC
jgi:hypothetical protein